MIGGTYTVAPPLDFTSKHPNDGGGLFRELFQVVFRVTDSSTSRG